MILPMFEEKARKRHELSNANRANLPESEKGRARDDAARAMNVSPRSVEYGSKVTRHRGRSTAATDPGEIGILFIEIIM